MTPPLAPLLPAAVTYAGYEHPVLSSGRGVRRQHGATRLSTGLTPALHDLARDWAGVSGLEDGRDTLTAGGADRDQPTYGSSLAAAGVPFLLRELLGPLSDDSG